MEFFLIVLFLCAAAVSVHGAMDVGVCCGTLADNLPSATSVMDLYKKHNIGKLRLFNPNPDALNALRGRSIEVTVGVPNEDVPKLAATMEGANQWFETNVKPYLNDVVFEYITVGNEIVPGDYAASILPAMQNLQSVLDANGLAGVKVSTVLASSTLGVSFPPSAGAFTPEASSVLGDILRFLSGKGAPLLINVYPYFAYASDPADVRLDYAQFTAAGVVMHDGDLSYSSLFDAILDSFFAAMEKLGVPDVDLVVSESGWPSAGNGNFTTPELASTYNQNFVKRINSMKGTPKRPDATIEGFIFAMFNENQKPPGVEQNFGLFYPNMEPVYPVVFQ